MEFESLVDDIFQSPTRPSTRSNDDDSSSHPPNNKEDPRDQNDTSSSERDNLITKDEEVAEPSGSSESQQDTTQESEEGWSSRDTNSIIDDDNDEDNVPEPNHASFSSTSSSSQPQDFPNAKDEKENHDDSHSDNDNEDKQEGWVEKEPILELYSIDEESEGASIFNDDDDDGNEDNRFDENGIHVYGDGYDDAYAKEESDPSSPRQRQRRGGALSHQKKCLVYCLLICILISLIAGAVLGSILANEDSSFREMLGMDQRKGGRDTEDPTPDPDKCPLPLDPDTEFFSTFDCPEDNVALEIRIVFDAEPGEVGINVVDTLGLNMWNFPPGSFGSFALLLRENIFTLCLTRYQNYTLHVVDAGTNGLISNLGADIFGSFRVTYADQLVTTYNGDCRSADDDDAAAECGAYCQCSYFLAVNASAGQCATECDSSVVINE